MPDSHQKQRGYKNIYQTDGKRAICLLGNSFFYVKNKTSEVIRR